MKTMCTNTTQLLYFNHNIILCVEMDQDNCIDDIKGQFTQGFVSPKVPPLCVIIRVREYNSHVLN